MSLEQHKFNAATIEECAANLEGQNNDLYQTLENSYNEIVRLKSTWNGPSAEATYSTFEKFRENYFTNYKDAINQYVVFLREVVIPSYQSTEEANKKINENAQQHFL